MALGRPNVLPQTMDAVSSLRWASERGTVSPMVCTSGPPLTPSLSSATCFATSPATSPATPLHVPPRLPPRPPWQVAGADAVLSLLPAPLHATVAEQCIAARTPLVTASYVSPELAELHDGARRAGVPLLCELGLDPGLDHMSAAAMIAQAHTDL